MAPKSNWLDPTHFQFGLQLGSDPNFNFGPNPNVWDQQFQDPYNGGPNPLAPQPTGFGGGQAQPWGGMPQQMEYPQELTPQQQGPAGYQGNVMSDIDLRDNPYYDDGYAGKHPAWHRFLQYTGSPQFADSMMAGAIAANISTNPIAAMQQALAFKQHRDQRAWQGQQNELQRQAMLERTKYGKDISSQQKMYYQIDLARKELANAGVADLGEVPEDQAAWPSYLADLRGQLGKAKQAQKTQADQDKALKTAFQSAFKTGVPPPGYEEDPTVLSAAGAYNTKNERANIRLELQQDREKRIASMDTKTPGGKQSQLRAKGYDRQLRQFESDINRYEQNIDRIERGDYIFTREGSPQRAAFDLQIAGYEKNILKTEEARDKIQEKWDALVFSSESEAPEAGRSLSNTKSLEPGYWKAVELYGQEKADADWRARGYGEPPVKGE